MSEPGPWNRQPATVEEWLPWLEGDERLLWFYPRRGETREWTARMLWAFCSIAVALVALFDWFVPEGPSERHGVLFHGFVASGALTFIMLILDLMGVGTKRVADWLNEASAKVAPRPPNSMRTGVSALTQRRFLRILEGNFVAVPLPETALVSGFRLRTASRLEGGRVLLRDVGFREEHRLDAALQLARALREGRVPVPA